MCNNVLIRSYKILRRPNHCTHVRYFANECACVCLYHVHVSMLQNARCKSVHKFGFGSGSNEWDISMIVHVLFLILHIGKLK